MDRFLKESRAFRFRVLRLSNQLTADVVSYLSQVVRCAPACIGIGRSTKHLEGRAGRAQIGGHGDLSLMTSAPQHHGAFILALPTDRGELAPLRQGEFRKK